MDSQDRRNPDSLRRLVVRFGVLVSGIAALILFPLVLSFTADLPRSLVDHYRDVKSIYWEILQITTSPVFDEPETTLVRFYYEKPAKVYIESTDKRIFVKSDTLWTYLVKHKQIQKQVGAKVFNPLDFIDSTQAFYRVADRQDNAIRLHSVDGLSVPDSLQISYGKNGAIQRVEYLDVNQNLVAFEFLQEHFGESIPEDNFLARTPEGVETIDVGE